MPLLRRRIPLIAMFSVCAVLSCAATSRAEPAAEPLAIPTPPARAAPGEAQADIPASADAICQSLIEAARANRLPVQFFTRLIWQESRFKPSAVSPKGARGIAQFMPGTAELRGVLDPFEPLNSLAESAEYLRELWERFGNLGLAAAAYNAGERRLSDWIAGRGELPQETRNYVRIITGHPADAWRGESPPDSSDAAVPRGIPCETIAGRFAAVPAEGAERATEPSRAWQPWGVQVAGHWSGDKAIASYTDLQKQFPRLLGAREPMVLTFGGGATARRTAVRVPMPSRPEADKFCGALRAAGGHCAVYKSPTRTAGR